MTHYGQLSVEKLAADKLVCRQIVDEISKFGISEQQRLFIIYLLSLELENLDMMKALTSLIKNANDDIFIADKAQED